MITIHYPGKYHDDHKTQKQTFFTDFWTDYIVDKQALNNYNSENRFFNRFLLFHNGIRKYFWNFEIDHSDNIIIVAANKVSLPNAYSEINQTFDECYLCSNPDVACVDVLCEALKKYIGLPYCSQCFIKMIEEKAFSNLNLFTIPSGATIDLGLSGERDSSLALHFLMLFRQKNNLDFKINCTYNFIGLGDYDKNRIDVINKVFRDKLKNDKLNINILKLPIEESFKNGKLKRNYTTYGFCRYCYRGGRFREYGLYNDTILLGATGKGTIEDKIISSFINAETSFQTKTLDHSLPLYKEKRWLTPLEGISEDYLSLYAALEKIDYCIDDCPISPVSTLYRSRHNVLNNLKAVLPDFKSTYKDIPLNYNHTIFGKQSAQRKVLNDLSLLKCSKCDKYHDLGNLTLKDIINSPGKNMNRIDTIEKHLEKLYRESEYNWYANNFSQIDAQDVFKVDLYLSIPSYYRFIFYKCFLLVFDIITDKISLVVTSEKLEENIIKKIQSSEKPLHLKEILEDYPKEKYLTVFITIHKLMTKGLLLKQNVGTNIQETSKHKIGLLLDNCMFFNTSDGSYLENLICGDSLLSISISQYNSLSNEFLEKSLSENSLIIITSANEEDFRILNRMAKQCDYKGDLIYIFLTQPMTIGMGCYDCLNPEEEIKFAFNPAAAIENNEKNVKLQILSVLSDFYLFDNCSRLEGWKRKNMLYYINVRQRKKMKELIICHCDR